MRVITGSARGRRLKTLDGLEVRPTTDKVKESIFSIIQFDIPGSKVVDLFAGSGQLGIEALSRGAESCFFIDKSKKSIGVITENVITTEFEDKATVITTDSIEFAKTTPKKFDIALLDPPYNKGLIIPAIEALESKMSDVGKIICEHEMRLELPEKIGRLNKRKNYKYGKLELTLYEVSVLEGEDDLQCD